MERGRRKQRLAVRKSPSIVQLPGRVQGGTRGGV